MGSLATVSPNSFYLNLSLLKRARLLMTLARPDVIFPMGVTWAVPVFLILALPSVNASDRLV